MLRLAVFTSGWTNRASVWLRSLSSKNSRTCKCVCVCLGDYMIVCVLGWTNRAPVWLRSLSSKISRTSERVCDWVITLLCVHVCLGGLTGHRCGLGACRPRIAEPVSVCLGDHMMVCAYVVLTCVYVCVCVCDYVRMTEGASRIQETQDDAHQHIMHPIAS